MCKSCSKLRVVFDTLVTMPAHELHIAREVFARHGVRWRSMTRAQQLAYEHRGRSRTSEQQQEQHEQFVATKEAYKHQLHLVQNASDNEKTGPLRVGSCRMTLAEIAAFNAMWDDPRFAAKQVHSQRVAAVDPAQPLAKAEQDALLAYRGCAVAASLPTVSWVRLMCRHRSFFQNTLVQLQQLDGVHFFATLLLQQSPHRAAFLKVIPFEDLDDIDQTKYLHAGKANIYPSTFVILRGALMWSHVDTIFSEDVTVLFMKDACFFDDDLVASQDGWHTLEDFRTLLHNIQPDPRPDRASRSGHRDRHADLVLENPWVQDILAASSSTSSLPARSSRQSGASTDTAQPHLKTDITADDMPMEDVVSELQRQRDLFMADLPDRPAQHFKTTLRGGAWTARHVGAVADSARAYASSPEAKQFCVDHGLPQSATFALNRFGSRACGLLALYWVSRMSWLMEGGAASSGTASSSAQPSNHFIEPDFAAELDNGPAHTAARMRQLRALSVAP